MDRLQRGEGIIASFGSRINPTQAQRYLMFSACGVRNLPARDSRSSLAGVIVGILSDTHDRPHAMMQGVRVLQQRGAEFIIHCGDVGSPALLDHLAGVPSAFVWGNTDWDRLSLQRYAAAIGVTCCGSFGELELDGRRFAVLHGDDDRLRRRVLDAQKHDYLLQGHTHVRHDERIGRIRLINPGALHRAAVKTVAVLDTAHDDLRFETIAEGW
jgi:uncharacterized protein